MLFPNVPFIITLPIDEPLGLIEVWMTGFLE
jgi:hypothetical protein